MQCILRVVSIPQSGYKVHSIIGAGGEVSKGGFQSMCRRYKSINSLAPESAPAEKAVDYFQMQLFSHDLQKRCCTFTLANVFGREYILKTTRIYLTV